MKRTALAATAITIAVLFGLGPIAEAQQPIRIGASLGLTGTYAELGQTLQRGYQLCVKQANEKGGLLKRRLELTVVGDEFDRGFQGDLDRRREAHGLIGARGADVGELLARRFWKAIRPVNSTIRSSSK